MYLRRPRAGTFVLHRRGACASSLGWIATRARTRQCFSMASVKLLIGSRFRRRKTVISEYWRSVADSAARNGASKVLAATGTPSPSSSVPMVPRSLRSLACSPNAIGSMVVVAASPTTPMRKRSPKSCFGRPTGSRVSTRASSNEHCDFDTTNGIGWSGNAPARPIAFEWQRCSSAAHAQRVALRGRTGRCGRPRRRDRLLRCGRTQAPRRIARAWGGALDDHVTRVLARTAAEIGRNRNGPLLTVRLRTPVIGGTVRPVGAGRVVR